MGGKNAAIVLDDADIELALEQVMFGAFRSTGQKCTATSRLIVTDGIAERFLGALRARADALIVGDPTHDGTEMGPVVSDAAFQSISAGIETATAQGAHAARRRTALHRGPVVRRILHRADHRRTGLPARRRLDRGTVRPRTGGATRRRCRRRRSQLANDSEFGLSAALFTQDLTRVLQAVDQIDVGVLHVNSESAGADPHVPFGGAKKSGLGPKEQGGAAREFFTHTTTVYLRGGAARA